MQFNSLECMYVCMYVVDGRLRGARIKKYNIITGNKFQITIVTDAKTCAK